MWGSHEQLWSGMGKGKACAKCKNNSSCPEWSPISVDFMKVWQKSLKQDYLKQFVLANIRRFITLSALSQECCTSYLEQNYVVIKCYFKPSIIYW